MPRRDFAAGFVIFRLDEKGQRTYLVVKNIAGHWELPKGHPKDGESWIQTALRELEEETGIEDARPIPGFARQIEYVFRNRRVGLVRKTVCFALSQTKMHKIHLSREHTQSVFLQYDAAISRLTHAGTRAVLRDAEHFLRRL
jgi:8-oxo-dGTP pyrophosphatase MutT (NUDIX family)